MRWAVWGGLMVATACGDNRIGALSPDAGDAGDTGDGVPSTERNPIATAPFHACAIVDGRLSCWGYVFGGSSPQPPSRVTDDTDWFDVVAGQWVGDLDAGWFTCALRASGERWCWGDNSFGELGTGTIGVNAALVPFYIDAGWARLSAGGANVCGIKHDGSLWCWGWDGIPGKSMTRPEPVQPRPGERWLDVACADRSTCAIREDHTLACWSAEVSSDKGAGWASVAAGADVTCGIKLDGTLWCFGANDWGQLGRGATSPLYSAEPAQVGPDTDWATVRAAADHVCALKTDGASYCWGSNAVGALGNSSIVAVAPTLGPTGPWNAVAAYADRSSPYRSYSCARTTGGEVMCWGTRTAGTIDPAMPSHVPIRIGTSADWTELGRDDVARKVDGSVHKWNLIGIAAASINNLLVHANVPTPLPGHAVVGSLSGGCFVQPDDSARCGANSIPACPMVPLGSAAIGCPFSTTLEPGSWKRIDGDPWTRCGIDGAAALKCWGDNAYGALGNGSTTPSATPVPVQGGGTWLHVSTGSGTTCGVQTTGSLWCWGDNRTGQLGLGSTVPELHTPAQVGTASDWTTVVTAFGRTCGLRGNHSLWCWGRAGDAGLGDGTSLVDRYSPVPIGNAIWAKVSVAGDAICGVQDDQSLWCWGRDTYGQLGLPATTTSVLEPALVASGWVDVAANAGRTCGIKIDGSLWCWGDQPPRGDLPLRIPLP